MKCQKEKLDEQKVKKKIRWWLDKIFKNCKMKWNKMVKFKRLMILNDWYLFLIEWKELKVLNIHVLP